MVKEQENYEFFTKEYEFVGKHARMVFEMMHGHKDLLKGQKLFGRYIDILIVAPIIGFRLNKKVDIDTSELVPPASVFPDTLHREKDKLEFIMQMILLLDDSDGKKPVEHVERAFQVVSDKETFNEYFKLFNRYVLGGVEVLYEKLIQRTPAPDEPYSDPRMANIMALIDDMKKRSDSDLERELDNFIYKGK